MKFLGLILAAAALLIAGAPAKAATSVDVVLCPGGEYAPESTANCPPALTDLTFTATGENTGTVNFTVDQESGTAKIAVDSCSAGHTQDDMLSDPGGDFYESYNWSMSGGQNRSATGLTHTTQYCTYVMGINSVVQRSAVYESAADTTDAPPEPSGEDVFPMVADSFCQRNYSLITNASATYTTSNEEPLDGTFTFGSGCDVDYTRGSETGEAYFDVLVDDYDGAGNDLSFRVFLDVR